VERYAREVTRRLPPETRLAQPGRSARGLAGHLWEQTVLPGLVGADRLWSPANTGPLAVERQVVTIHDVLVLEHPEWYPRGFVLWYRVMLPRLARRARRVMTVSEESRGRLLRILGLDPQRVALAPGGVDLDQFHPLEPERQAEIRRRLRLPERYLLFIGGLEPRKNQLRLAQAWAQVSGFFPDVELVLAGGPGKPSEGGQAGPGQRNRNLGYVDEADLAGLYAGAEAFLYPSLDEGFGLPVLEAMACGTPVIASSAGAIPSVAGGAALLVDPYDVDLIAQAICQVLTDPNCHAELRARGLVRAALFSWDATAHAVLEALNAI
jgi:glycosyltransferase involved in cell wall biosynthesis